MIFIPAKPLICRDCGTPITLKQYQRKVARCDPCEEKSLAFPEDRPVYVPEGWEKK